jgi:pimeloyl-ACP methyl ester carboxylesterase
MGFEHNPYNTEDNAKFVSQTTPTKTETLCKVTISPDYVIPIIFIPGIMGSNIKDKGNGQHVWYPPNSPFGDSGGLAAANAGEQRDARTRQLELNPETTIVGQDGFIDEDDIEEIEGFDRAKALNRGWGSVWWKGYSKILIYMEKYLNHELIKGTPSAEDLKDPKFFSGTKEWKNIVATKSKSWFVKSDKSKLEDIMDDWGPLKKDIELLSKELHGKLANYSFPVFAIGYNWLQSNDDSAKYVAEMMNRLVKPQIKKEFPEQEFKKFIIVTHSMGGLVARSLILEDSVKNDILGVMHGVMPASGAPTVYQRICRGWEGGEVVSGWKASYEANRAREVFGATSERLMPVLANSPGALQLLPFANFLQHKDQEGQQSKAWLTLRARNRNGQVVTARLPKNEPYEEVYTRTDTWWSMINEDFLDPAGILNEKMAVDGKTDIISYYIDNMKFVRDFHNKIADSYHPNTYAHYGLDEEHLAYNEILWSTEQNLPIDTADDLIDYKGYAKHGARKEEEVDTLPVDTSPPPTEEEIASMITIEPIVVTAQAHDGFEHLFDQDSFRTIEDTEGNLVTFNIRIMPTSAGDGTVCGESGADVAKRNLKQVFVMRGLDHAASYDDENVHRSTIYSIAKIVENLC